MVSIFLLSEIFLNPGQAFRLANYVYNRTDRPTAEGGMAILVRRDIFQHSVPVSGLTHSEVTDIQVILAGRPVKIRAAYVSPSPWIGADPTAYYGGELPVFWPATSTPNTWIRTRD